jgi:hypothetical protein
MQHRGREAEQLQMVNFTMIYIFRCSNHKQDAKSNRKRQWTSCGKRYVALLLCSKFSTNIYNLQNLEASKTNCTGIEEEKNEKSIKNSINNEGNTIDQHKYSKPQFEDDEFDKDTKQGSYDNENAKELSKESK